MLLKSYELTDIALNWAVAKANKYTFTWDHVREEFIFGPETLMCWLSDYTPSFNWEQAGALLEELKMSVMHVEDDDPLPIEDGPWTAAVPGADWGYTGPTALIAICRCYVQHKLGDDVEIPDELLKG